MEACVLPRQNDVRAPLHNERTHAAGAPRRRAAPSTTAARAVGSHPTRCKITAAPAHRVHPFCYSRYVYGKNGEGACACAQARAGRPGFE